MKDVTREEAEKEEAPEQEAEAEMKRQIDSLKNDLRQSVKTSYLEQELSSRLRLIISAYRKQKNGYDPKNEWSTIVYKLMNRRESLFDAVLVEMEKVYPDIYAVLRQKYPELNETEIVDVKWQLSNKTSEYTPVIIVKPVIMDGKEVTRASAHNYGYVIDNKISIGTKVILSLAGDIIPFIYKVTDTTKFNEENIGINTKDCIIEGVHLYKKMSKEELVKSRFLASAKSLNIPGIGPAIAERIFDYLNEKNKIWDSIREFYKDNILFINSKDIFDAIGGKLGENAQNAFETYVQNISLKDIIISCSFPLCGEKVAEQVVNYIVEEGSEDWTSLPSIAYNWCFDANSTEMFKISRIMNNLGKNLDDERKLHDEKKQQLGEQIPIMMTGEPNDYATKAEFLKAHPEYRETGSWKEVKILFTNSLESNSGKMKKAKDKGIEIKLY